MVEFFILLKSFVFFIILSRIIIMLDSAKKNNIKFCVNLSIVIIALISFFVLEFFVVHFDSLKIDDIFYTILHDDIESNFMTGFYKYFTHIGSFYGLIVIALILLIALKNKKLGVATIVNLIIVGIFNFVVKMIVRRPRPDGINIITESGYSFPSGHSMVSMAYYGLLMYFVFKKVDDKEIKYIIMFLLGFLILLIGFSRIYLGVHYASDVIGGFLISIVYLIWVIKLLNLKVYKN